jgi:hypothetical protein
VVTSTSVAVSPSNPVSGQAVTLTATVAGTGPPSGVVSFTIKDGNNKAYNCAGGSNAIALSGGSAACTISSGQLLSTNSPFTMSATYPGDADNAPSTWGPTNLVVTPGQVHLSALTGTGSTPKGGNWQATVTAMVTDASGNTVSGVVVTGTWAPAGPAPSGCTTMANGQCSFTAPGIPAASGETWTIAGLAVPGYTYDPTKNSQSSEAINHA